jgi:hypothetical protein
LEVKNVIRFISLREKIDKVKEDALAPLSDQLLVPKRIFNNIGKEILHITLILYKYLYNILYFSLSY